MGGGSEAVLISLATSRKNLLLYTILYSGAVFHIKNIIIKYLFIIKIKIFKNLNNKASIL